MKLAVKEFQEHVNAMTDDEVRESISQAERATAGFNNEDTLFLLDYVDADGVAHQECITINDIYNALRTFSSNLSTPISK